MISMNRITKDTRSLQTQMMRMAAVFVVLSVALSSLMARVAEDRLWVWVIDNGEGMDVDKALGADLSGRRFNNIGIGNIRERLRLNYGDGASLTYQSQVGQGTEALLVLPRAPRSEEIINNAAKL